MNKKTKTISFVLLAALILSIVPIAVIAGRNGAENTQPDYIATDPNVDTETPDEPEDYDPEDYDIEPPQLVEPLGGADFTFALPDMTGGIGETQNEMWESWDSRGRTRSFQPTLTDVSLSVDDGNVIISGVLDYGNGATPFETYGTIYVTDAPDFPVNLVHGDMNGFGNIHFTQFRMSRTEWYSDDIDISFGITLQRIDNHHLMTFDMKITNEMFDVFHNSVRSENLLPVTRTIEDRELALKIARLAHGDFLNEEYRWYEWHEDAFNSNWYEYWSDESSAPVFTGSDDSLMYDSNEIQITPFSTDNAWRSLVNTFNSSSGTYAYLDDFGIDPSLFASVGWNHDFRFTWDDAIPPFHASVYTRRVRAGHYFVQVTFVHFTPRNIELNASDSDPNKWEAGMTATYQGGFIAQYNPHTGRVFGMRPDGQSGINQGSFIDNFALTIYMPNALESNRRVFVSRRQSMNVYERRNVPTALTAIVPLIPKAGSGISTAITISRYLFPSTPESGSDADWQDYLTTFDAQLARYGDTNSVIRGVHATTGSRGTLRSHGHHIILRGRVNTHNDPNLRARYSLRLDSRTLGGSRTTTPSRATQASVNRNATFDRASNPFQRGGSEPYRTIEVPYGSSVRDVTAAFPAPCRLDEGYLFIGWIHHNPNPNAHNFFSFREPIFEDVHLYPHYWRFPETIVWGSTIGNQNISTPNTRGHAIYARGGGNTITLTGGDNLADPGTGNNTIFGGMGTDVYSIGRGYGLNRITANSNGTNTVRDVLFFTDGITLDEVFFIRNGLNLEVIVLDGGLPVGADRTAVLAAATNRVVLVEFFWRGQRQIVNASFDNGEVVTREEIIELSRILYGTATGNDVIRTPDNSGHTIFGVGGNNTITLTGGNNRVYPGTGNNTIMGGLGTDTYVIGRGYGLNRITANSNGTNVTLDMLEFTDDITPDEVFFVRNGWHLEVIVLDEGLPVGADRTVLLNAATNRVVLVDFFWRGQRQIVDISFDNGEVITREEIIELSRILYGTATGNDVIRTPDNSGHTIFGIGGNNTITLTGGNNRVYPGTGNSTITGGMDTDTYVIGRGYGLNRITANSNGTNVTLDMLEFTDDITPDEVFFVRNGFNLEVIVLNGGLPVGADRTVLLSAATNRVVLVDFFWRNQRQIVNASFDNGEVITREEIIDLSRILYGTATGNDVIRTWDTSGHTIFGIGGNNTITLTGGNNRVYPGTGNNTIIGGMDTDTYVIGRRHGVNRITANSNGTIVVHDMLVLTGGIMPGDVDFIRSGWNLEVIISDTTDNRVVFVDFFRQPSRQIVNVSFDNGAIITRDEILARVPAPTMDELYYYYEYESQPYDYYSSEYTITQ